MQEIILEEFARFGDSQRKNWVKNSSITSDHVQWIFTLTSSISNLHKHYK